MQRHRRLATLLILTLLLTPVLAAHGGASAATNHHALRSKVKAIGLVLSGPIGVNPFLQGIKDGVEQAGKALGVKPTVIESSSIPAIEDNLKRLVQQGNDLIVCNSFESVDALTAVAAQYPRQRFLIIDATVTVPNVSSAVFKEYQSAFLAGAEAALVSKTKKVGFVGAEDIPLLHRWSSGYEQGISYVNATAKAKYASWIPVRAQIAWMGSFTDVAKAKELAAIQGAHGADIIFAPAGAGEFGVFEAAKSGGFKVIAVDSDYRAQYPRVVIDSQLKNTAVATAKSIVAFSNGDLPAGAKSYGLKEEGVDLASIYKPDANSNRALGPVVIARLKELRAEIISDKIKVRDPLAQK